MEHCLDLDSLKCMRKTVAKCIGDLGKKGDLSPQETKAAYDGACLYDWLTMMIEECDGGDYGDERYSERRYSRSMGMHHRPVNYPMHGESYGYSGSPGYPSEFMDRSYCGTYDYPMDRRMSRGGEGYSRHSIGDRAVERLENLMDSAGSDYEKEQLHKYIRMIRAAAEEG